MEHKITDQKANPKEQFIALLLCSLVFSAIYTPIGQVLNLLYSTDGVSVLTCIHPIEKHIPFIEIFILPYFSSGIFFVLVFFLAESKIGLKALVKRMLFIIIVSGLCFLLFPLKYSELDLVRSGFFFHELFGLLDFWDTPFNQAPSLHVSFTCIYWVVISRNTKIPVIAKKVLFIWMLMIIVSTLVVYQHRIIDILTAFTLISITFFLFPIPNSKRNSRIAATYFFAASLLLISIFCTYPHYKILSAILLWITLNLAAVGNAYFTGKSNFLKQTNGEISLLKKVFYFPYLVTYLLLRKFFCKNSKQPIIQLVPSVYFGASISGKQATAMQINTQNTYVFDLTAEQEESKVIRQNTNYYSFPLLDLAIPEKQEIDKIIETIYTKYTTLAVNETIYIHCLMGYSRSIFIASILYSMIHKTNIETGIKALKSLSPYAVYPTYLESV